MVHGRVGDSPIIGSGLFVDGEVGAACATGIGEAVIRVSGSAIVVELMRQGKSPEEACRITVERIISKHKNIENMQVGFLALNKKGVYGGFSIYNGFSFALRTSEEEKMMTTPFTYQHQYGGEIRTLHRYLYGSDYGSSLSFG